MKPLKLAFVLALLPVLAHAQPYPYNEINNSGTDGIAAEEEDMQPIPSDTVPSQITPTAPPPAPNLQSRILMQLQNDANQPSGMQSVQVKSDDPELEPDPEPVPVEPRADQPPAAPGTAKAAAPADAPVFRGTIRDFKTVHFSCTSDTKGDYLSSNICTMADMRVRELARDARLNFKPAGKEDHDGFTLSVKMQSNGITVPRAVTVRVEASRLYDGAIDTRESYVYPAAGPRAGRLVFWETTFTAVSGSHNGNLDSAIREYLRGMLKRFFSFYQDQ